VTTRVLPKEEEDKEEEVWRAKGATRSKET
jgi:hypothetical protein